MPFHIKDEQKRFKFATDTLQPGGLPIAEVIRLGGVPYVVCCPCCGMLHEIRHGEALDGVFQPNCIVKRTHPRVYAAWLQKHPQAADFAAVVLRLRQADVIGLVAQPTARRTRAKPPQVKKAA